MDRQLLKASSSKKLDGLRRELVWGYLKARQVLAEGAILALRGRRDIKQASVGGHHTSPYIDGISCPFGEGATGCMTKQVR